MAEKLLHRDSLLSQLAGELKTREKANFVTRLAYLKVTLYVDEVKLYEFLGAQEALYELVEGLYWNEEANWSEANRLTVEPY